MLLDGEEPKQFTGRHWSDTKHERTGIYDCGSASEKRSPYLCQFQTGLPLSSRSTSVSVPFTTSRARIRSVPSCLTFEPVRLTSSPLVKDDPISSRNDLGQRYTSKVLSPLFRVKRAPSFSLPFSGN